MDKGCIICFQSPVSKTTGEKPSYQVSKLFSELPRVEDGEEDFHPTGCDIFEKHTLFNFDIWGRGRQSNLFLKV